MDFPGHEYYLIRLNHFLFSLVRHCLACWDFFTIDVLDYNNINGRDHFFEQSSTTASFKPARSYLWHRLVAVRGLAVEVKRSPRPNYDLHCFLRLSTPETYSFNVPSPSEYVPFLGTWPLSIENLDGTPASSNLSGWRSKKATSMVYR